MTIKMSKSDADEVFLVLREMLGLPKQLKRYFAMNKYRINHIIWIRNIFDNAIREVEEKQELKNLRRIRHN